LIKKHIDEKIPLGNKKIEKAIEWLKENKESEDGVYEIEGKIVYAIVQSYNTRNKDNVKWEAHRKYIDIQFILKGTEKIGISNIEKMKANEQYQEEKDIQFFDGEGEYYDIKKGEYMIIYPDDIHMPSIGNGNFVKKIVVKVSV